MALKVFNATQRKGGNGKQTLSAIKNAVSFFNKKNLREWSTNVALFIKRRCILPVCILTGGWEVPNSIVEAASCFSLGS